MHQEQDVHNLVLVWLLIGLPFPRPVSTFLASICSVDSDLRETLKGAVPLILLRG
jgi:hypothetical protein